MADDEMFQPRIAIQCRTCKSQHLETVAICKCGAEMRPVNESPRDDYYHCDVCGTDGKVPLLDPTVGLGFRA